MSTITTLPIKTKTGTPVTLAEAKAQLQIESSFTADDTHIQLLTSIALEKVEADTNTDVQETTNTLEWEPETTGPATFEIYQAPLLSFTKLQKLAADGVTWNDVATTDYKTTAGFSKITIETLATIATTKLKATYKTGYAAADIPRVLKGATLLKLSDLFDTERQGYRPMTVMGHDAYASLIRKHIRVYY